MAIMQLNAIESAYADSENPNTAYYTQATLLLSSRTLNNSVSPYPTDQEKRFFLRFEKKNIEKKAIKKITLKFYTTQKQQVNGSRSSIGWMWLSKPALEKNFTYNYYLKEEGSILGSASLYYEDINLNAYTSWVLSLINADLVKMLDNGIVIDRVSAFDYSDAFPKTVSITVASSRATTNRPYLEVEYDDITPYAILVAPSANSFVDRTRLINFQWSFRYTPQANQISGLIQQTANLKWRQKGTTDEHIITINGSALQYTMPANTLGKGEYEWCVRVQSDDNIWSNYTGWRTITTTDEIPTVAPIGPIGTFVNRKIANSFSWSYTIGTGTTPTKSELQYSTNGTSWTALATVSGAALSTVIPANTLPSGQLYWRVRAYNIDGIASPWSEAAAINTVDSISTATPVSPINVYIDRGIAQTFTWQHSISTGTPSTKSELQYSTNGNNWLPLATVNGAGLSVVIPADTLPLGNVYWRVRTYNLDGVAGNWSDTAAIIVQGQTPKPVIQSFNAASRLYAIWNAVSAVSSQIQIRRGGVVLIDSGEIFTPMYLGWLSPEYLPNGSYTFAVRVKSSTGQWSSWTTRTYEVNMPALETPQASYTTGKGFVEVQVANFYDYTWVYLLRDGVKIARLTQPNYIDWTAGTVQQYQVQGLLELDGYANSEPQTVPCLIQRGCLLSGVANPSALLELYVRRNEPVSFAQGREYTGTLMHFAGREYPVMEFSPFANETVEISLTARMQEEWKKIQELLARRETILYRDRYGQRLFGVALGITSERDPIARDYSITIQRVDYKEDVPYLSKEEITGL